MFIDIQPLSMDRIQNKPARKTILIVDSSLIARRMVRFSMQGIDCEILEAAEGTEAVRILHSRPIDLVVTDMNVPNLDGFELSRIIRETAEMADLPIILLSLDGSPEHKDKARKNGISLLMTKPFTPEQFYGLVMQVLK